MKNVLRISAAVCVAALSSSLIFAAPPPGKGKNKDDSGDGGDGGSTYVDPKSPQVGDPVRMGTSGGWADDLANGYCCGGTLGALVENTTGTYILSNYHVLVADISDGGNGLFASTLGDVIQPALIDVGCNKSKGRNVATLAAGAIPIFSKGSDDSDDEPGDSGDLNYVYGANVDAALALVIDGEVDLSGDILNIGPISKDTVGASVGMRVQKMGRTTGHSSSKVTGLNATISVRYENECAGESVGVATFYNQIVIENKGSKFLAGGDSGSVMFENGSNPRAVGLLFAGSRFTAIANPIEDVLDTFGVTMVGSSGTGAHESAGASASTTSGNGSSRSEIAKAIAAQKKGGAAILKGNGIVGHGVSLNAAGKGIVKVYVESLGDYDRASVPASIDGVRVEVEETGRIVAF